MKERRLGRQERDVNVDEGLRGEKGQRLSWLSFSCLLQLIVWCTMVHRQSVNGMGEEEGWGGRGAEREGEGKEDRGSQKKE